MPRHRKNAVDATEQKIGREGLATMEVTGEPKLVTETFQVVDDMDPLAKDHADKLAFMEELVTVVVHHSSDKFAKPIVEVFNDGRRQMFPRGVDVTCKRKFVEVLARAKPVNFRNEEYRDADGNNSVRWPSTMGLEYPFSIVRDENPLGPAWLKSVLAAV